MSIDVIVFGLLLCFASCVSGRGYKPMLLDLADNGSCKNDSAFVNFDLTDVPQFGALCSSPFPRVEQYDFLVENNAVPILCMGVFDVFQRLCQTSSTSRIFNDAKESSLTSDRFSKLFKNLNKSDQFALLDQFCSNTVLNSTIAESSSNISQFWWKKLNTLFTVESSCKSICRTNEDNRVQPLCSFIIWSNQVILRNLSVQGPPSNPEKTEGEIHIDSSNIYQPKEVETNQVLPTTSTQERLKPTLQTDKLSDPVQHEESQGENKEKLKQVSISTGDSVAPQPNQILHDVKLKGQENLTKSYLNNSSSAVKTQLPTTKVNDTYLSDIKQDSKLTLEKVGATQNQINQPSVAEEKKSANGETDEKLKEESNFNNGVAVASENEGKEETKINPEKAWEEAPNPDLALDINPEESEIEQPISDKDLPQTPFAGEDIEDGDGDDIETEVEISKAILAANQTTPSNNKPGVSAVDTGVEEPDKAYGEVREIVIEDHFIEAEDSHFFTYFLCMAVLTIMAYLAFHNKKKLVALALEGRRTRGTRRRPNSSNYSKLDCNLEEALVSNKAASVTHVLY